MQIKNEVTGWQLFYLVVQTQVGIGVLSMQKDISIVSRHDAWISLAIGGILIQLLLMVFLWLLLRAGEVDYFILLEKAFGQIIGKLLAACYLAYFIYILLVSNLSFTKVISEWIYMDTPRWILMLLFLIPAMYCASGKVVHIARFSMLVSIILPVLVMLLIPVYSTPNYTHFFPIGSEGAGQILKGLEATLLAYIGFESFLYFSKYVRSNREKELKKAAFSTLFVTVFYLFLLISTQVYFHIEELVIVPYAVLYILKSLSFVIVDRIDLIFLSLWIVIALTSFVNFLFIASNESKNLFHLKSHKRPIIFIVFAVFVTSLFIKEKQDIIGVQTALPAVAIIFTVILPLGTLCFYLLFRKEKEI
ncbi:GerAB/ArcD/ProY family transporter [Jeotgalibacillus terrae]|uniref:GerAB/ArcD/ProY family transporter n=1 Tax=Jeotgalibacillus terrae TaxID=587735 RepID=A0ABW5ZD35_9BACL|nr:GerAB/ArcD/ProY family transporter [Jeotgalibacillus terrae]MBM7579112.1 spore germination protein (amino acid permease) [Jeotgalibacillus terrae]